MIRIARIVSGVLGLILTIAALVAATGTTSTALPFYRDASLTPEWISPTSSSYRSMHRIGEFALSDQNGQRFTSADVRGKVYVATFFFTNCHQLCPKLLTNLTKVQTAFRNDRGVMILSHTVNPEADDTATLARYARVNHIDSATWRLLTGTRKDITALAHDSYFVELSDTTGHTQGVLKHTETAVLVDEQGRIRGVYDGSLAFDVERMIDDIRVLRAQALR